MFRDLERSRRVFSSTLRDGLEDVACSGEARRNPREGWMYTAGEESADSGESDRSSVLRGEAAGRYADDVGHVSFAASCAERMQTEEGKELSNLCRAGKLNELRGLPQVTATQSTSPDFPSPYGQSPPG